MIRQSLTRAALAGGLLWAAASAANAQEGRPSHLSPQTQKINELIAKGWADAGIKKPAAKATDHEFMRRVFIDLIGRIPMPEEIVDFEMDRSADKRSKLVQRLIYEKEYKPKGRNGGPITITTTDGKTKTLAFDYGYAYAEHWAEVWTVWLMTRSSHEYYRNQIGFWLTTQFAKNVSHKDIVTQLIAATGKGNENGAINFVMYQLGEKLPAGETGKYGNFDAIPITSRVTRLFLGIQTQCTQCHDHPMNKQWLQADFWGVNAFFRQTNRSGTPMPKPANNNQKMNTPTPLAVTDEPGLNGEGIILYERRDGKRMASYPTMLKDLKEAEDGKLSAKRISGSGGTGKTRREQLAEWVVNHDNFSRAYVNRAWGHFFGRGLMKEPAYDDFGNTEVVHTELLDYLGEEFAKYGYDYRKLHEWICTSDVYQLSHVANKDYADPVKYDPYFARMPLKALSPEVLFESLIVATRSELRESADERQAKKAQREQFMAKLVQNFGDDEGNELSFNGTVIQALLMMNGRELNDVIGVGRAANTNNVIAEVIRKRGGTPAAVYDELFLMALGRHPTGAEVTKLEQVRAGMATVKLGPAPPPAKGPNPKGPKQPAGGTVGVAPGVAPGGEVAFYQDVFWALLNTNEFMLNH
jgi:hypothetical protein